MFTHNSQFYLQIKEPSATGFLWPRCVSSLVEISNISKLFPQTPLTSCLNCSHRLALVVRMLPLISRVYLLDPIGIKLISLIVLLTTGLELFDCGVTHPPNNKPRTTIPKIFFILKCSIPMNQQPSLLCLCKFYQLVVGNLQNNLLIQLRLLFHLFVNQLDLHRYNRN